MKADREAFAGRISILDRDALLALALSLYDEMEEMRLRHLENERISTEAHLMSIYIYVLNHNAAGFSLRAFADRFNIDQIRHIPYEDECGVWDICLLSKEKNQAKYSSYVDDFRL